jgi:hypothetical protein
MLWDRIASQNLGAGSTWWTFKKPCALEDAGQTRSFRYGQYPSGPSKKVRTAVGREVSTEAIGRAWKASKARGGSRAARQDGGRSRPAFVWRGRFRIRLINAISAAVWNALGQSAKPTRHSSFPNSICVDSLLATESNSEIAARPRGSRR